MLAIQKKQNHFLLGSMSRHAFGAPLTEGRMAFAQALLPVLMTDGTAISSQPFKRDTWKILYFHTCLHVLWALFGPWAMDSRSFKQVLLIGRRYSTVFYIYSRHERLQLKIGSRLYRKVLKAMPSQWRMLFRFGPCSPLRMTQTAIIICCWIKACWLHSKNKCILRLQKCYFANIGSWI